MFSHILRILDIDMSVSVDLFINSLNLENSRIDFQLVSKAYLIEVRYYRDIYFLILRHNLHFLDGNEIFKLRQISNFFEDLLYDGNFFCDSYR